MTPLMSPRTELSLWLRAGPRALSLRAQTEGRSFPLLQRQLFHPLQHSLHLPLSHSRSLCAQPAAISGTVPCQANSSCSGSISALFGKSRPQSHLLTPQMSLSLLSASVLLCLAQSITGSVCAAQPSLRQSITFCCPHTAHPTPRVPKMPQARPEMPLKGAQPWPVTVPRFSTLLAEGSAPGVPPAEQQEVPALKQLSVPCPLPCHTQGQQQEWLGRVGAGEFRNSCRGTGGEPDFRSLTTGIDLNGHDQPHLGCHHILGSSPAQPCVAMGDPHGPFLATHTHGLSPAQPSLTSSDPHGKVTFDYSHLRFQLSPALGDSCGSLLAIYTQGSSPAQPCVAMGDPPGSLLATHSRVQPSPAPGSHN